MSQAVDLISESWTAADLVDRFGAIPLYRIRPRPAPGSATEEDVLSILAREGSACELVDGVLVEKTVGAAYTRLKLSKTSAISTPSSLAPAREASSAGSATISTRNSRRGGGGGSGGGAKVVRNWRVRLRPIAQNRY